MERENVMITKEMTVGEAMAAKPEIAPILMGAGMFCVTCPASQGETMEEAAMAHGFDIDDILDALNAEDENFGEDY